MGERADGSRVVLEPVLGPETRGEVPAWPGAAQADGDDYGHLVAGTLEPGLQTGSCASTGGGWSEVFAAHASQLHPVDDDLSQPLSCAYTDYGVLRNSGQFDGLTSAQAFDAIADWLAENDRGERIKSDGFFGASDPS